MSQVIETLVSLESYRELRQHLFRSPQSLQWFLRQHRRALVERGALLVVAGQRVLDSAKADEVLLEIGKRSAGKAVE